MSANASGEARPGEADGLVVRVGPEPIDPGCWYRRAVSPEQGAVAQFCGIVRNHHQGDVVLRLEYDAYSEMAESVIHGILLEARRAWPIRRAFTMHRTGSLEPGEVALCVTVASDHRQEAMTACQFIVDRLKERAPIWKRETLRSGETRWIEEGRPDQPGHGS